MIHRNMNKNENGTNQDNLEEVIDEWPDDTNPVVMEDFVNEELENRNQNDFIDENETELHDEEEEKSIDTENEDVIHRIMNENET